MALADELRKVIKEELQPVEGRINQKLDTVDKKIDTVDKKLETVEGRINQKIDTVDKKIDTVEGRLNQKLETLRTDVNKIPRKVVSEINPLIDAHEREIESLKERVLELETVVEDMQQKRPLAS